MHTGGIQSQPILNKQAALFRMGGDEQILKLLAQAFVEDIPELMQQLYQAVQSRDAQAIHHTSHKIKGLTANFDAFPTMQLAALLETRGRQEDLTAIDSLYEKLQTQIQLLEQAIQQEVLQSN